MRIFKVYSIFLFLVFLPSIAICSSQMPNSSFKIDSENKLFSLISIPETKYSITVLTMKEKKIENKGAKYSEMLVQLIEQFDELLPKNLTFEEMLEVGIEAWNLANNKVRLNDEVFQKELKAHNYNDVIEKMIEYKLEHFAEHKNMIVDFSNENGILQIKSQTFEQQFNSLLSSMININPPKKNG